MAHQLTELGKSMISIWWTTIKDYQAKLPKQKEPWDMTWHLVIFSFPNAKQSERNEFTEFLQSLGFGILNKGVWISPYNFSIGIAQRVAHLKISEHLWRSFKMTLSYPSRFLKIGQPGIV